MLRLTDGLTDILTEADGDILGDTLALRLTDGDTLELGLIDAEGLILAETLALGEMDAEILALGDKELLTDDDRLIEGDTDVEGDRLLLTDAEGLMLGQIGRAHV